MVYGVFGGCYSDWYVVGYFENKKDAEDYCKRVNEKIESDFSELYVVAIPNLDADEVGDELVGVMVNTDGWRMEGNGCCGNMICEYGDSALIYMELRPSQYHKAIKIAQDRWARYKAEKEGIV